MPVGIGALIGGIVDAVGAIAAPAAAAAEAIAPEAIAGGAAAAEAGGAIALPEIAVTAAAPEIAGGVGAGLGADVGAGLIGGAGAGALDLGLTGGAGAGLTGGALAGAAPVATEGISTVGEALGGGATGPLAALDTGAIGADFAQVPGATSTISDLTPGTLGIEDVGGSPIQSFAGTTPDTAFAPGTDTSGLAAIDRALGGPQIGETFADLTPAGAPGVSPPLSQAWAMQPTDVGPTLGPGLPGPTPLQPPTTIDTATLAGGFPAGSPEAAVASAVPAVGAAPAGGGISGAIGSVLSSPVTQALELAAPLGFLGYNLMKGPAPLPPAMQQALNNSVPAQNLAKTFLQNAANNTLTPAQMAQIQVFRQNAVNQLYQSIANRGENPQTSTDYALGLQQIDLQVAALQQTFINAMVTNGLAALGNVDSTLQSAANMQVANDNAFNQAVGSSLQAFALTGALASRTRAS